MKSNKTTSFKKKVQAMKASEIVQAMIDGLKKEWVTIDMFSYGHVNGKVCYGCAATNAICQITNHEFTPEEMNEFIAKKAEDAYSTSSFIRKFEAAINALRKGRIDIYNLYAKSIKIKTFPLSLERELGFSLPWLVNQSYKEYLPKYQELADLLRKKGL